MTVAMAARDATAAGAVALLLALAPVASAAGQSVLERPAGLPEAWAGIPWSLELSVRPLFGRAGPGASGLEADPAIRAALPLPASLVAELRYAPQPVERDGTDEVEAALRWVPVRQDVGRWVDLAVEGRAGVHGSELLGAGATVARWLGPVRLMGAGQAFFSAGRDEPIVALGGGAVLHPGPGRLPIALAGDAMTVVSGGDGDDGVAWSAALQVGVGHTAHTLSLFATNAGNSMGGRVVDIGEGVRYGVELTTAFPVGRFFGLWPDRTEAREAVREAPGVEPVVRIRITDYRYAADRVVIPVGTAVEWVNEDAVVHTATSDTHGWSSGGLGQGEAWRVVFDRPGVFPYYCGPHPYMRGVVVVTDG